MSVDIDVTAYAGGVAFWNFGEFECRYTCVVTQDCPEWTFPVISEDCFTCATVENGEVLGGACDSGCSWSRWPDGPPVVARSLSRRVEKRSRPDWTART